MITRAAKLALVAGLTYFALDLWLTRQLAAVRRAAGESDYERTHKRK